MEIVTPPFHPLPPVPPTEVFLPFSGEPAKAAEVRLRASLKLFRIIATNLENVQRLVEYPVPEAFHEVMGIPSLPPQVVKKLEEIKKDIWKLEAVEERRKAAALLLEIKPEVKERLLAIEGTFIEREWHLPKWKRPSWLVE